MVALTFVGASARNTAPVAPAVPATPSPLAPAAGPPPPRLSVELAAPLDVVRAVLAPPTPDPDVLELLRAVAPPTEREGSGHSAASCTQDLVASQQTQPSAHGQGAPSRPCVQPDTSVAHAAPRSGHRIFVARVSPLRGREHATPQADSSPRALLASTGPKDERLVHSDDTQEYCSSLAEGSPPCRSSIKKWATFTTCRLDSQKPKSHHSGRHASCSVSTAMSALRGAIRRSSTTSFSSDHSAAMAAACS